MSEHPSSVVIGVCAYATRVPWPTDPVPVAVLPSSYLNALRDVGAVGVVIPVGASTEEVVARVDGILLVGGPDVEPSRYGAPVHPKTGPSSRSRDESETNVLRAARERSTPVLGICRGAQMMNVTRGGTLVQHLPDRVAENVHSSAVGPCRHPITALPGSQLARIVGTESIDVESTHHQAVEHIAPGLVASAYAPDGTIEAIEAPGEPFFIGVQWHPEDDLDRRLFAALVAACCQTGGRSG
jgi:gamma-glutamyl-gamma-aminobutyrate hydrolase PuuD